MSPSTDLEPARVARSLMVRALPASADGSAFHRHRRSGAAAAGLAVNAGVVLGLPLLAAAALLSGSLPVGLLALVGGLVAGPLVVNRGAVLGNARLRASLRRAVEAGPGEEFVGLCLPGNNSARAKLFTPRVETDDNVGFLHLSDGALRIRMEEGVLVIPRDAVRNVTMEPMVELPWLRWVVVHHDDESGTGRLLVTSREGETLRAHRRATEALHARVSAWFVEHVLDEGDGTER